MVLLGEVKKFIINPSGYECCTLISFDKVCKRYWCYALLNDYISPLENPLNIYTYVEDGEPIEIKVNDKREFKLSIVFANSLKILSDSEEFGIEQPINKSSHSISKGIVIDIIDKNLLVCNIEPFSNIPVNFERAVDEIDLGKIIEFNGEIKIECV